MAAKQPLAKIKKSKQTTRIKSESASQNFLNSTKPFDPRILEYDSFLANLQGNILKGHGRDNTVHLLVWFNADKAKDVKSWIAGFAKEKITSFKEQLRQREVFKRNRVGGGLFAGIYLTGKFYKDFKFVDNNDKPATGDFENGKPFFDGMAKRKDLQDDKTYLEDIYKQPKEREDKTSKEPIHAMILLAHEDVIELNIAAKEICEELEDYDPKNRFEEENSIGGVLTAEYGAAIRNSNGDGLEHFGYVDGISQPLFLKEDVEEYEKNNVNPVTFNPFASLKLVLVKDPFASAGKDCYGSYFVYRKLEQDVHGFKHKEHEIAKKTLKLSEADEERMGAMIIGRFEDGTPLTLSGDDKMISSGIMNNFNYDNDGEGLKCPFHAHIRKTNPRRNEADQSHRMARRGITYGHRNVSTTIENHFVQMPKGGVGLLFMSFQSNIENQFEHLQAKWANSETHPANDGKNIGIDLIIGQGKGSREGYYTKEYNKPKPSPEKISFENFINLKGGEYFFAPSVNFLKSLASTK